MIKVMVAITALAWTSCAAASDTPAYLTCTWTGESQGQAVDLAIDEANQRMTVGRKDGQAVSLAAMFTPEEVRATERVGSETVMWTINRIDLSLKSSVSFSPNIRAGTCKIKPAPAKRAF